MKPYDTFGGLIAKTKWYSNNYIKKVFIENNIEITHEQWVLIVITKRSPGITQTELAKSAQKDKAAVTRMLDILSKGGYLIRKNDKNDRRTYRIFLTEKGEKIFEKTVPISSIVENRMLQNLSENEIKMMKDCLTRICATSRELIE